MCGICGMYAITGALDTEMRQALGPMTAALAHRGPDGKGHFSDTVAALGHRRLAIIDRAGGRQPMTNEDESCWIVFNGEVYNHRALRRTLADRGHVFRTTSDTEAILHAYEEYGPDCVRHLDGMFAFAIYDSRRRELLLARDRLGKKPLYFAAFGDVLHFASEIKALRQSPAWDGTTDLSSLEGYLSLGYFLAPYTAFSHVRQLEPGHVLRARGGRFTIEQYWDVDEFDTDLRTEREILPSLERLIRGAVTERLESEVPLGAFLSGGIDSGLVVSFMREASAQRTITTTVGFRGAIDDESAAAAMTARHLDTDHHADAIDPQCEAVLDRIISALDQPFADVSAIPTYYLSAMARRHVTVALSGDGGDETFGGYAARYLPHGVEAEVRRGMGGRANAVAAWLGARWPRSRRLPRWLRLGTVLENISRDDASAYYADLCFLKPHEVRALLGLDPERDPRLSPVYHHVTAPYRRCSSASAIQRAQYADLKVYLPNDVLVKVDRMSMAHGLEIRSPLLDHRLIEAAFRIPARTKLARGQSKRLLRQLARTRLPDAIAKGKKRGFDAPIGAWIAGPYQEIFRADVLETRSPVSSLLDTTQVRRLLNEHCAGAADHAFALWAIWVLARWAANSSAAAQPNPAAVLA